MASLAKKIEEEHGRTLTNRQRTFARHIVEGIYEEAGQFSAAINAEKIRAALGGLTVDRREQVNTIDALSREEIVGRLADLQKRYPQAFQIEGTAKDVTPDEQGTRGELLELNTIEPAEELPRDKD